MIQLNCKKWKNSSYDTEKSCIGSATGTHFSSLQFSFLQFKSVTNTGSNPKKEINLNPKLDSSLS